MPEIHANQSANTPANPLGTARQRTFDWIDPKSIQAKVPGKTGLEFLKSLDPAHSAPIAECLDFQLTEVENGRVVFEITPAEYHYNPMGSMHGGVMCTLCDSATGAAVHSTLAAGMAYTSLEVKVNFLKAVTSKTGRLRCEGKVVSSGSRVAVSEARLTDASGKLYATANSTCLIFEMGAGTGKPNG